jgi:hypothetical protein
MFTFLSNLCLKPHFVLFVLLPVTFALNAAPVAAMPSSSADSHIHSDGKVLSIQQGGGYSFIEVQLTSSENVFLASPILPNDIDVGATIAWGNAHLAKDYYSHALERTFTELYIITFKLAQIEAGIIESIQTVGANTYLAVNSQQKQLMLVLNNNQKKSELLQGALIEWQRAESQPYLVKSNISAASPLAVEWVRIALTSH